MKVVINRCWGGFGLSEDACKYLGLEHSYSFISRDDPRLVECVETLGSEKASGICARLVIVEIPDGINYGIEEHDGIETIVNEDYRDKFYINCEEV